MKQLSDSGDDLQIKFRLLISQNHLEEADTLLREHPDEFVEMEGASLADIRFSLLMQRQDWAAATDLAAKEPDGTGKRRLKPADMQRFAVNCIRKTGLFSPRRCSLLFSRVLTAKGMFLIDLINYLLRELMDFNSTIFLRP